MTTWLFGNSDSERSSISDITMSIDAIASRKCLPFVHTNFSVPNDPQRGWKEQFLIEQGESPDVRTTMAFSLDNSRKSRPEFVVTGADPDLAETMMNICNTLWDLYRANILDGRPIVLGDRYILLMPITQQGLQSLNEGALALKAADLRMQASGIDAPNWVQIVHSDAEGRFPWDEGHVSILFQPVAAQAPRHHAGSVSVH